MVISHWLLCQIADGSDGRETRGGGGGGGGEKYRITREDCDKTSCVSVIEKCVNCIICVNVGGKDVKSSVASCLWWNDRL